MAAVLGSLPKKFSLTNAPFSDLKVWKSPSGVLFIKSTSAPSRSAARSGSHSLPQTTLITFQPAPPNIDSNS
ncbi:unannotated protein [freshwater metagenome]|uniref:Unannotated protein n=1 Tax=freshwater metagenome TaxID=449393 RepID=A0A6J6FQQ2_9ZZZZ